MSFGAILLAAVRLPQVVLDALTVAVSGGPATYTLNNAGVRVASGHANADYLVPAGTGSATLFEARATHQSGTAPTGTYGSWLGLETSRVWSLGSGTSTVGTILIEIRDKSTQTVRNSAVISFDTT